MKYNIPIKRFEDFIAQGLWVGHEFECNGESLVVTSVGQVQVNECGERVIPLGVEVCGASLVS